MEKREVPENPVIKAVFFDVYGTLLSIESNQVPDSAKEAVKKFLPGSLRRKRSHSS